MSCVRLSVAWEWPSCGERRQWWVPQKQGEGVGLDPLPGDAQGWIHPWGMLLPHQTPFPPGPFLGSFHPSNPYILFSPPCLFPATSRKSGCVCQGTRSASPTACWGCRSRSALGGSPFNPPPALPKILESNQMKTPPSPPSSPRGLFIISIIIKGFL